jgi:RHS repeat-associated protein
VRYVHTDQLSGSNAVTNSNGYVEEVSDFYPFGTSRMDTKYTSFNEPRKYAGTIHDDSTSLDYMSARYYNSSRGQFISEDPLAVAIGDANKLQQITGKSQQAFLADPQQLNSYGYARDLQTT